MARAKGNYEDLVRLAVTELRVQTTVLSITLFPTQGFSSTTYSVELGDQTSIVVQVRPSDRPLALSNLDVARSTFGSLVPLGSFLTSNEDQDLLLYSMSQIPGRSLDSYLHEAATIPVIASSLGTILAKAIVHDTEVSELISSLGGKEAQGLDVLETQLHLAAESQTDVKAFSDLKPLFVSLLERLRSTDELRRLPFTISNGDISPTNTIIQNNTVSGIVDWEYIDLRPLGYDTEAIFWLMGLVDPSSSSLRPNSEDIERSFWSAFSRALPANLRSQHATIELALHIAAAVRACPCGRFNDWWAVSLRKMTEYRIPMQYWTQD